MKRSLQSSLAMLVLILLGAWLWKSVILAVPEPPTAPPRDLGPVSVESRELVPVDVALEIEGYGNLEPKGRIPIALEVGGRLVQVHPGWRPGASVRAGEELVALDAEAARLSKRLAEAELAEAKQALEQAELEAGLERRAVEQAEARLAIARREAERAQELFQEGVASAGERDSADRGRVEAELAWVETKNRAEAKEATLGTSAARVEVQEARVAQAVDQVARHRVLAPFDGVFADRGPTAGRLVNAGESLGELLDPTQLVLVVRVPEAQLAELEVGFSAEVDFPGAVEITATRSVQGRVSGLYPLAETSTRRVGVEIEVHAAGALEDAELLRSLLPAGRFARAVIATGKLEDALWIDRAHLRWEAGEPVAYVLAAESGGSGEAQRRVLELGREHAGGFLVSAGLALGEHLITTPLDRMADGVPCRPRTARSNAGEGRSAAEGELPE